MALFGNLLTCYAVYRNKRFRTLPNMFVLALGVSDILMSTCSMPFSAATLFHGHVSGCLVRDFADFTVLDL